MGVLLTGCLQGSLRSDDPGPTETTARQEFDQSVAPAFKADNCTTCHVDGGTNVISYDSLIMLGYTQGTAQSFSYELVLQILENAHRGSANTLSAEQQKQVLQWLLDEQSERD